jgi:alpha-L-arabinofuranosidase
MRSPWLLLLVLAVAGCRARSPAAAPTPPPARALELRVDVRRPGTPVSPRLFGTNIEPNAEVSRAVMERARSLGITTYRFPGGGSPGWRWRSAVLDKAPEMTSCPLARIDTLRRFLDHTSGEAVMQLNIETGTPEEAADLLRWMRDPAHPVRGVYFEVGNEPYGDWDAAYRSPEAYAETVRRIRRSASVRSSADPTTIWT